MLSFLILIIFAYNIYISGRRGLLLQGFYTLGYFITLLFAQSFYQSLATKLTLLIPYPSASLDSKFTFFTSKVGLDLDSAFYAGCAFLIIVVLGWAVTHLVGLFLHNLIFIPIDPLTNVAGSAFLGFFVTYTALFLILYLLALIPVTAIQTMLEKSWLATLTVRYTPFLTKWITRLWIVK
ncbi:CvpA family protein [Lapidilactobacillus bayanensis]|uniref:CvpA family protein n=1 Tax=Lapidilactobacillus bayanensis TaxID=2485998 RepID=UPI000F76B7A2|nr:CvpA family protein [Lapidilactobacillus bayanensis]